MPRKATNTQKSGTTKSTKAKKIEDLDDDFFKKPTVLISQIKTELKYKNETQKKMAMSIKNNDVTICTGPAGTGKSYVACIQALNELKNNENIKKIVLVKSVTTLKSEEIGFLKGTMEEKMEPFMYSFVGNFEKIIGKGLYEKLKNGDFVVSTMTTHSVREMVEYVFKKLDLDYEKYVTQNVKFLRAEELKYLKGDSTKIRETLGWKPEFTFETLMDDMINGWLEKLS